MPAPDGPEHVDGGFVAMNSANIELADIVLRRPSLDDVFLSLTRDDPAATAPPRHGR